MDAVGTPSAPITYDPWGAVTSGSVPTFGFTGELQQGGLVDLRARWYSTGSGAFISRDSFAGFAERPDTLHPYGYVGNQPISLTDPSGHCYAPVAFLRDLEPLNCSNLDQAIRIAQHPNASVAQRLFAGSYITSFVGSHAALLVGAGVLTWEAAFGGAGLLTTISQWGASNIAAGTATGHALSLGGAGVGIGLTAQTIYQALSGDPTAQAFLACPGAFGMPTLWNDLGDLTLAGYRSVRSFAATSSRGLYLFRGTTEGWPGNASTQRAGVSPASANPAKATLFAIESSTQSGGGGVVYIASSKDLAGMEYAAPNVLALVEEEIPVGILPEEFAARASIRISVEEARSILAEMGISTPSRIYSKGSLNELLQEAPRMNIEQIQHFIEQAERLAQ